MTDSESKQIEAMTAEELIYEIRMGARGEIGFADGPAEEELLRRFAGMNNRFEVHVVSGVSGVFATVVEHSASTVFTVEGATEDEAEAAAKAWITERGG